MNLSFKKLKFAIIFFAFFSHNVQGANYDINSGQTLNSGSLSNNDTVNFLGTGTLNINSDISLGNISSNIDNIGSLIIDSSKILTSTNIGSSSLNISSLNFNTSSVLNLSGDIFIKNNIVNANNNSGNINITSNLVEQNIGFGVSSALSSLNEVNISNNKGVIFSKEIYSKFLKLNADNGVVKGSGSIIATSTDVNFNTSFKNLTKVNFGDLNVASTKSLNLETTTNIADNIVNAGTITLSKNSNLEVLGNVTNTGAINSLENGGIIKFSGSLTQNIENQLGTLASNIGKIIINNSNNAEVFFKNDLHVKNIDFNNDSSIGVIKIDSAKTLNLSGNIASLNNKTATIYGSGTLNLNSANSQTIEANLGKSAGNSLAKLTLSTSNTINNAKVSLNADSYIANFEVNESTNFENKALLNISNLKINDNFNWEVGSNSSVNQIELNSSKNLTLKTANNLKISGDLIGTGSIISDNANNGVLWFASSLAQNVGSGVNVGLSTNYLYKISTSNIDNVGINFNNDVYVKNIDFLNNLGTAKLNIATAKNLNISGNILQKTSAQAEISGAGSLNLLGNSLQTIEANIGNNASRLSTLIHNNTSQIYFTKNIFVDNFNFNQNNIKLAGNIVLDTNNLLNLAGKKIDSQFANNNFGRINVNNDLSLNSSTFNLDFSNISGNIDITGATNYSLAKSSTNIIGDVAQINLSDNSFLFDGKLSINNNELFTSINFSDNYSKNNIGEFNFNLISQAINQNLDVKNGLVSISNKIQLDNAIDSLKPIADEVVVNNILSNSSNILNIVDNRYNSYQYLAHLKSELKQDKVENNGLWWQIYNNLLKQETKNNNEQYSGKNLGLIMGYDRVFQSENLNLLVGSSLATGQISLKNKTHNKKSDINFYNLVFYNHNSAKNNGLFNKNSLFIGFNRHNNLRNIEVGNYKKTANSSFKSSNFSAQTKIGYEFDYAHKYSFAPFLGGQYFILNQNQFLEKNANKLNLNSKINSYREIIAEIGFEASAKYDYKYYKLVPNFGFSYDKNMLNKTIKNRFNFAESEALNLSKSVIMQKNKYNLALGFDILIEDNQQLKFKSNSQIANNFINWGAAAQYNWEF